MPLSSLSAQSILPANVFNGRAAKGLSYFRRLPNSRLDLCLGAQVTTVNDKHRVSRSEIASLSAGLGIPENPQAALAKISIRGSNLPVSFIGPLEPQNLYALALQVGTFSARIIPKLQESVPPEGGLNG